jgi:hypothetical protein
MVGGCLRLCRCSVGPLQPRSGTRYPACLPHLQSHCRPLTVPALQAVVLMALQPGLAVLVLVLVVTPAAAVVVAAAAAVVVAAVVAWQALPACHGPEYV